VHVRIDRPELLVDLCDFLSREGLIAVGADAQTANVLVPQAQTDLDAELLVRAKVRAWQDLHPDVSLAVGDD
jgi:hypothetical protein